MKPISLLIAGVALAMASLRVSAQNTPSAESRAWSSDLKLDYSFVGEAQTHFNGQKRGNLSEHSGHLRYDLFRKMTDSYGWRVGIGYDETALSVPTGVPVPDRMEAITLRLGDQWQFADQWTFRAGIEPGIYHDGNDVKWRDVNAPFYAGVTYEVNPDLTWMFGLRVDVWSDIPLLPGAGVRWKFADDWTLNLMFPKPRLQYAVNDCLTAYVGGDYRGGSYRTSQNFKVNRLNNEIVDHREIRVGAGADWNITGRLTGELEAGYVCYHRFEFDNKDVTVKADPAPYVSASLRFKF